MKRKLSFVSVITILTLVFSGCQTQVVPATGMQPVEQPVQNPHPVEPVPGEPQPVMPGPGEPQPGMPVPGEPQPVMPVPGEPHPEGPNPAEPQPAMGSDAQIISFSSSRTSMYPGQCAMLEWNTQGGHGISLNNQPVERVSQEEVCPSTTTSFRLMVDTGKEMLQREILINVTPDNNSQNSGNNSSSGNNTQNSGNNSSTGNNNQNSGGCAGAPVIQFFNANSTSITSGQSVTLSWGNITNGNTGPLVGSAKIEPGLGEVGSGASSRTVTPNTTTTYTLTATGCGGSTSKQVTVTVNNSGSGNKQPPVKNPTPKINTIPAQINNYDLAVTNVYPAGNGHIMVTVKNVGNVNVKGSVGFQCSQIGLLNMPVPLPNNKSSNFSTSVDLKPGAQTNIDTSFSRGPQDLTMQVICTITPPNGDSNSANNTKGATVK